jgi:hypothetical protein
MGFFKRKTKAPLSAAMYQGDNATPYRGVVDNAMATGNNNDNNDDDMIAAEENKKFLQRFRTSWKKSPGKARQKQDSIRLIQESNNRVASGNEGTDQSPLPPAVTQTIDHSDDRSIPSLITEPEDVKNMIMDSLDPTTTVKSTVDEAPVFAPRTATSFSRSPGPLRHVVAPSHENFQSGPTPRRALTLGERFLSLLQCGEYTTTSDGYFGRIKCLELCAQVNGDEHGLGAQRMDEEDQFVVPVIHVSF